MSETQFKHHEWVPNHEATGGGYHCKHCQQQVMNIDDISPRCPVLDNLNLPKQRDDLRTEIQSLTKQLAEAQATIEGMKAFPKWVRMSELKDTVVKGRIFDARMPGYRVEYANGRGWVVYTASGTITTHFDYEVKINSPDDLDGGVA